MSKREEYISFINEIKSIFPTISDRQRKELLRRAVQQYDVSVDDAVDILNSSGLVIGEEINYFEVLGLSISEFEKLSESDIVHRVEAAHKKLYAESLQAGGRPRADGRTEEQWRTLLNQARDTLIDPDKRLEHLSKIEQQEIKKGVKYTGWKKKHLSTTEQGIEKRVKYTGWKKKHLSNIEQPKAVLIDKALKTPNLDNMVLIPAGEFQMGNDEYDSSENEKPAHTVYVDGFYIDKYPVTNEQYREFVDANPQWNNLGLYNFQFILRKFRDSDYLKDWHKGKYPSGKANHPVNWVSWHAAMAYSQWVGKRLPTEAEWEKAARGGLVGNKFPWGNAISAENANYNKRVGETTPVGKYPANRYGVFDIIGNVSEWCLDEWKSKVYKLSEKNNPISGGSIERILDAYLTSKKNRVLRGGSWNSKDPDVRVSSRACLPPWKTNSFVGFRCVMSIES